MRILLVANRRFETDRDTAEGGGDLGAAGAAPPADKNCMKSAAASGSPFVRP
jgi:hypothetical protein